MSLSPFLLWTVILHFPFIFVYGKFLILKREERGFFLSLMQYISMLKIHLLDLLAAGSLMSARS